MEATSSHLMMVWNGTVRFDRLHQDTPSLFSVFRTIKMMRGASSMLQGGLLSVEITGTGTICVGTHGTPLVLVAGPNNPLYTDPHATVCWSSKLNPSLKVDVNLKSLIGRGSGEEFQVRHPATTS